MAKKRPQTRTRSLYTWDRDIYNVEVLKSLDFNEKALREEYKRLRKLAYNRLQRLKKAGFDITNLDKYYEKYLSTAPQEATRADLAYGLADAARFLDWKSSTVQGRQEYIDKSVEKLQSHGYYFVNASNFENFSQFMEEARLSQDYKLYSSERIAMTFETMERLNIKEQDVKNNFKEYLSRYKELSRFEPTAKEEQEFGSELTLHKIDQIKAKRDRNKKK